METVSPFAPSPARSASDRTASPAPSTERALATQATYLLSEEGRKASLLAGGDGREVQQIAVQVPANRLHLVSVDAQGVARLKLRPRYQLDGDRQVLRVDAFPVYDAPPELEDLFREAARNHQLEHDYQLERRSGRAKRRDAERERRAQIARAFLNDPTQRALLHPPPTPQRCQLAADDGRVAFDANSGESPGRAVPAEAYRRFRVDLRAEKERNRQTRATQDALHEEKKRAMAEWIAAHGSPEQQRRLADNMLPLEEAIETMADDLFAVLSDRVRFPTNSVARLQAHLRGLPRYMDIVVDSKDVLVLSRHAPSATADQWAFANEIRGLVPDAEVNLRVHRVSWKRHSQIALDPVFSVLVTQRVGPFVLRREYVAPDDDSTDRTS